jgi:hypothetical protein
MKQFTEVDVQVTEENTQANASAKPTPKRRPPVKKDPEDPKVKIKELEAALTEMTLQRDGAYQKAEHYFAKLKEVDEAYQGMRRKISGLIDDLNYATVGLNKAVSRIEKSF